LEGGYKVFTIRELKAFLNKLPDEILDSPILIEDESVNLYKVTDINHTYGQKSGHKLILEFDHDHKTE
jgi:hypothetical protein